MEQDMNKTLCQDLCFDLSFLSFEKSFVVFATPQAVSVHLYKEVIKSVVPGQQRQPFRLLSENLVLILQSEIKIQIKS